MVVLKNTECSTQKEMEWIFFPLNKKEVDMCFYELYFLSCEKWINNLFPDSCQLFSLNLR